MVCNFLGRIYKGRNENYLMSQVQPTARGGNFQTFLHIQLQIPFYVASQKPNKLGHENRQFVMSFDNQDEHTSWLYRV